MGAARNILNRKGRGAAPEDGAVGPVGRGAAGAAQRVGPGGDGGEAQAGAASLPVVELETADVIASAHARTLFLTHTYRAHLRSLPPCHLPTYLPPSLPPSLSIYLPTYLPT